jgi:dipeptidyl-peptidase-4
MLRKSLFILTAILAFPLLAQRKVLTLETIYDPAARVLFSGVVQRGFEWIDDRTFFWPARDAKDEFLEWRAFDLATGKTRPLFDKAKVQRSLDELGVASGDQSRFVFDAKKSMVLIQAAGDLFVYSIPRGTLTRLTSTAAAEEAASFSPDGQRVAFVRNNDLYVVDVATQRERRLTTTGLPQLINGRMDWVYEEEIYGRGNIRGYWWSPDSRRIVFLQLDERDVPEHTIVDHIPYRLDVDVYNYPKAGDPNPRARLFIAPASGGTLTPIDLERYSAGDYLIVNVDWSEAGITYQVQNRQQTWLDLNTADPKSGESKTLFRDSTKAWVDPIANPTWLSDGSFLWQSERSGWRHIYHYKADGTLLRQVTSGEWEVRDLHGIDEKGSFIYFSGSERSVRDLDVYRVKPDGSGLLRLSASAGNHAAVFNPALTAYVDTWSDIRTPNQTRVHRADGGVLAVVEENRVAALGDYDLPQPEFLQVRARDGFVMEALMIKPPRFDPSKHYPVYQYLYGGPHAQQVTNRWRDSFMLFNQLLAQQGIIVWMCDNRTASGKGAVSSWPLHKELGASELRDVEDGIAWLEQQPYVDGSRIMLSGWSYGGFMVSYALTHSKSFVAGIAGAPVTDWRDYDTIYTERYLLTPQENPEGYKRSSPRWAAKDLHGNLLLIHGTVDDNVHLQNTIQFAYELQKAGKPFQLMLYPKSRHAIRDKTLDYHRQRLVYDFVLQRLKP